MSHANGWTCQRQTNGKVCKFHNPPRKRKCQQCGKSRPPRKKPAHMAALEFDYAYYIKLNGGEHCGVCGRKPSARRKLDRDHDHTSHRPRGLLCVFCNRALSTRMTIEWLNKAISYLKRAEEHEV